MITVPMMAYLCLVVALVCAMHWPGLVAWIVFEPVDLDKWAAEHKGAGR